MSHFTTDYGVGFHADCFDIFPTIPDASIDMVLCDLPYGSTDCRWDTIIPFAPLWEQYNRICKPGAAMVFTATQPFTSHLIMSNVKNFKHNWIWNKQFAGNFVQAKNMPLRICEDIVVFTRDGKRANYNPIMIDLEKPYVRKCTSFQTDAIKIKGPAFEANLASGQRKTYTQKYPTDYLFFSKRVGRGLHPTQKPVALFDYLIRTYTSEGDTVLDNCAGAFTTGVAAEANQRFWICIEKEEKYFEIGKKRFQDTGGPLSPPS